VVVKKKKGGTPLQHLVIIANGDILVDFETVE
jgi:hypothetical protein